LAGSGEQPLNGGHTMTPQERIQQIRENLNLPSTAQTAWSKLTTKEKKVFIRIANLEAEEIREGLLGNNFDSFPAAYQARIARAIARVEAIAGKFNAVVRPALVREQAKLKARAAA
jgi:hypothetical protein